MENILASKWQISEKTWPFDCDCFRFRISQNDRTWFGISQTIGLWETFWFGISQNDRLLGDFLIWNLSKWQDFCETFWFDLSLDFVPPAVYLICDALAAILWYSWL